MEEAIQLAGATKLEFGQISKDVIPLANDLYPALAGIASAGVMLFDVVKFEILRDFQQFISLFVAGDIFPKGFTSFWKNFSGVFSFCFSCWFKSNASSIAHTIFILECIVVIVVFILFYRLYNSINANDTSAGLETIGWTMVKQSDKTQVKVFSIILTTLFLPVSRDVLQIFLCDDRFVNNDSECYTGFHLFEMIVAVLCTIIFVLPTPIVFYKIIAKNRPQPSLYNKEGILREGGYTDENYRQDLMDVTSPFKLLFAPYERKWAFHKVVIMIMKVLLVLPATILVGSNRIGRNFGSESTSKLIFFQSLSTILVLAFYAMWCWMARPFLNSQDDFLDGLNRFAILAIASIGMIASSTSTGTIVFEVLAHSLAAIAFVAAAGLIISSISPVRDKIKNFRERIQLSESSDGDWLVLTDHLNPERERKRRIWHEFWDIVIAQDVQYRLPNSSTKEKEPYKPVQLDYKLGSSPPYLLGFQSTIGERHAENKKICSHESLESYRAALAASIEMRRHPDSNLHRDIALIVKHICGLDVFWDGPVQANFNDIDIASGEVLQKTKPSESMTHFGKAYVVPFPFCVVVVLDDVKEEAILSMSPVVTGHRRNPAESTGQLALFVAQNMSTEIHRRKHIRTMLRAMHKLSVYHYFQCVKQKTKSRTITDSEGNSHTQSYSVNVLFTFRNGIFSVNQHSSANWIDPATGQTLNMAHGFDPVINYSDGTGVDSEGTSYSNERHTLTALELGMTDDYQINASDPHGSNFARFLYNNWANDIAARDHALNVIKQQMDRYRLSRLAEFDQKEMTLSYAFWYFIYNNQYISHPALISCLRICETNPLLKQLPDKHSIDLAMLYQKMAFFDGHPISALWFIFWHDFWIWNQNLAIVKKHESEFDPFNSLSICYCPMPKQELIHRLQPAGLFGRKRLLGLKLGYLNDAILDRLYERIGEISGAGSTPDMDKTGEGHIHVIVAASRQDSPPHSADFELLNESWICDSYMMSQRVTGSDRDVLPEIASLSAIAITFEYVPDPIGKDSRGCQLISSPL